MTKVTLAGRALLALLLLIGFYALAVSLALGLLGLVYLQVAVGRFSIKLVLLCLVGAGTILWSLVPRIDRFEPPGPILREEEHPDLFQLVRDVAADTSQAMPEEIYLVGDMNAFVTQRGGVMGFFSRRVMGLGLPLLQVLTIPQLKAVIAHEFGHFYGGDTRLGPLIYTTRSAIARTVITLQESGSSIMHVPFRWYGMMFLRVTHAISRAQEYAADALAARVVGAEHLIEGLKVVHGGALAYQSYWRGEYLPAIASGFKPPLAEGFSQFLRADKLRDAVDKAVAAELESDGEDPYDTHPPLPKRIEALNALEPKRNKKKKGAKDAPRAVTLLRHVAQLEDEILDAVIVADHLASVEAIDWSDMIDKVYAPGWKTTTKELGSALDGLSVRRMPLTVAGLVDFAETLTGEDLREHDDVDIARFAADKLGSAIATRLLKRGWTVSGDPGQPFVFSKDEHSLELFTELHRVARGELSRAELLDMFEAAGVAAMRLGPKKSTAA